jgi:hypothetical protein
MSRWFLAAVMMFGSVFFHPNQKAYAQAALWRGLVAAIAAGWSTEAIAKHFGFGESDDDKAKKVKESQIEACARAMEKATDGRGDPTSIRYICAQPETLAAWRGSNHE